MPRQEDVNRECDRCGEEIDGFRVIYTREELEEEGHVEIPERWDDRDEFPMGTAGYYRTNDDTQWSEYADEDEEFVCDDCMTNDPRYQADYPAELPKS